MYILENENFKIEFIERIKIPLNFLYKIKVTCKKNNILHSKSILSNSGINLTLNNIFTINNLELFKSINMKKNEVVELYICFQKFNFATNQPRFMYDGNKIQVRL
jgi:hypothetical protein